jgi:flavin-dependent dehydrogenase
MLLARRGLRTLLLDHGTFGSDTLSTHALMRGGVMQLARWGLLDRIVDAGTPAVRRTTFRYGEEKIDITIKASHGVDALYAPRRTLLDTTLVRAAAEAGAEVHHLTSVVDLIRYKRRVAGVLATTMEGRFVELHAPLVIGADGIRSTVARRVAAPLTRVGRNISAATYGYWSDLDTEGYEWVFRRDAASGVIPTNDGLAVVFAGGTRDRIGRGGPGVIADVVAEGAPELAERLRRATPPIGARTFSGQAGYMRRASGPGWALVGDAGYFKDPISAHGITDALRDAELLARAVIEGGGVAADTDEALEEYGALRDRLSIPLFDIVDQIAGHEWTDGEIGDLLIRLSSAMTDEVETLAAMETDVLR